MLTEPHVANDLQRLHKLIDTDAPAHLKAAVDFLRIPSISNESSSLIQAAAHLRNLLESLGATVEFAGNPLAPFIFARLEANKPKTLLIYGMYDVQPVAGQAWSSPPFEPEVRDTPGIGKCLFARGACNSKGPLIGFLNALSTIRKAHAELPVNLIFTIEGEEEIGSPSAESFFRSRRAALNADSAFEPFWAEYGTDVDKPTLALGTKGIVSFRLDCSGGDWGGPTSRPVHSSVAAWISSPTWRLIRALMSLVDKFDNPAIPELPSPTPPTDVDERLLTNLAATFHAENALDYATARRFKYPFQGVKLLRHYYFSPTIQLNEMCVSDGDTIPVSATASLSIRLVPGMDPAAAVAGVRTQLARHGWADIEVTYLGGYPGSRTSLDDSLNAAILKAYRYHNCEPQIIPFLASSSPCYLFTDILGISYGFGGLGKAGGSHGIDEYFSVEGFRLFEKSLITMLYAFAAEPPR